MFPDGSIPEVQHESELLIRQSYDPWVHQVILQSLLDNQVVLDIGSGNMALDDPCIVRMDVMLSPYVDIVADAHFLPFLPESIDYIFSLAVFEHLRNPFVAARSIYEVLKDGGYIYHECNFVFAYHGYPHHYFNASLQGMEQIFSEFVSLRKGVATYQMPSFALDMVLRTYLKHSHAHEYPQGRSIVHLLEEILRANLTQYDIYFSEEEALNIAAGTYFSGFKQVTPLSTLIPQCIHKVWDSRKDVQERFPNLNDLTTVNNVLVWAVREGQAEYPEIASYLKAIVPFNKRGEHMGFDRSILRGYPLIEPQFGAIGFEPGGSMEINARIALEKQKSRQGVDKFQKSLLGRGWSVLKEEGVIPFIRKTFRRMGIK